jgi:hypothetical protein
MGPPRRSPPTDDVVRMAGPKAESAFGDWNMPFAKKRTSASSAYDIHPGVKSMQDWVASLKGKTGRSLEEWVRLVKQSGPPKEAGRRDWLKDAHGLGTNAAWWIVERADGKGGEDDDPEACLKTAAEWVDAMYAGGKAGMRPVHDRLIDLARGLGRDVKVCPCKTMVLFYRNHVFAEVKPSTRTRIDLGFALGKAKGRLPKRLIDTGGAAKKDRITHRFAISNVEEIDAEVERWLGVAYQLDE